MTELLNMAIPVNASINIVGIYFSLFVLLIPNKTLFRYDVICLTSVTLFSEVYNR